MWIVRLALRRPYTFVVVSMLIAILGVAAIISMPVDIFPYIDIPVVSVVWTYQGLEPEEMVKRSVTFCECAAALRRPLSPGDGGPQSRSALREGPLRRRRQCDGR